MRYKVEYIYVDETAGAASGCKYQDLVDADSPQEAIEIGKARVCRDLLDIGNTILCISPGNGPIIAYDSNYRRCSTVECFSAVTTFPEHQTVMFSQDEIARYSFTLDDINNEAREKISDALSSGKPFNTGWLYTVKESDSVCVMGDGNGNIHVDVNLYLGEVMDRIACIGEEYDLGEDEIDDIYDTLCEELYGDNITSSLDIIWDGKAGIELLLEKIGEKISSNHTAADKEESVIKTYLESLK